MKDSPASSFADSATYTLAGRSVGHQARSQVDGVAQAHERAPHRVAVGAAPQAAVRDPDLQIRDRGDAVERAQIERGRCRARAVVLVRVRRAEHGVEVGALVADRHLEEVAAVLRADPLGAADEVVELRSRVVVLVIVDAGELHEERSRRTELGEELAAAGAEPLVHGGQDPGADEVLRERVVGLADGKRGRRAGEARDDAHRPPALAVQTPLADLDAVAERLERRLLEHHLALLGVPLRDSELVDQTSGENVDQLELGIADHEAPRSADGNRHLHREADGRRCRRDHVARPAPSSPASRGRRPLRATRRRRRAST